MFVSHSKKFVFVHIPKTGGSTVTWRLRKYCSKNVINENHTKRGWQFKYHEGKMHDPYCNKYQGYYSFAFVRNPFDLMVSWYRKLVSSEKHSPENLLEFMQTTRKFRVLKTQSSYITKNNSICVDYVARFENFEDEFKRICNNLGLCCDASEVLNSSHNPQNKCYREYYDNESRKFVEEHFADDFRLFGYGY